MIRGICAGCGLPGHRYGTTDPDHDYSATACINGLRHENEVLAEALRRSCVDAWSDPESAIGHYVEAARIGGARECPTCGGNGIIGTAKRDCPDSWHMTHIGGGQSDG